MPNDHDDTDMTADEFLATRRTGRPVRVVKSHADYDEAISLHPMEPEDALRKLLGSAGSPGDRSRWSVEISEPGSVTIGSQRLEWWAVKVQG